MAELICREMETEPLAPPAGITTKNDLTNTLFPQGLECGVEIDGILETTHVDNAGNMIVLPAIPTIEHTEPLHPPMEAPTTSDVLICLVCEQTEDACLTIVQ